MYKNKLLISLLVLAAILNFSVTAQNKLSSKEKNQGWELLFNGNNFNGWRGVNKKSFPEKGWGVKDNTITCTGESGGSIITMKKYGNFELKWEWKMVTPGANSGLKYLVAERPGDTGGYGYGIEYQMLDDQDFIDRGQMKANGLHTTGAAYELYTPSPDKKIKPLEHWNRSKILSKPGKVEHWLNGIKILEYDRFSEDFKNKVAESKFKDVKNFGRHQEGHILLQDHNSEVYFRNIKIREL